MAQNIYYFVPIVNPDGVALIEQEHFESEQFIQKRKNMNPNAVKSLKGKLCSDADSGVDLNRNYPLYWGTPETFTLG